MNDTQRFKSLFSSYLVSIQDQLVTDDGEWVVKGFIDVFKNIYTISTDTKVVSKIVELMILPKLIQFGVEHGYEIVLTEHQNHYPDITFISKSNHSKIAVDIKSTYKKSETRVNGMTLGAFTGYFRQRNSRKNIVHPYGEYTAHFVLGILYAQTKAVKDEVEKYSLSDLNSIRSVVRDFDFFVQEKWRIASDKPGSGNTKNIGSDKDIQRLLTGTGLFTKFKNGEEIFNDYWQYYLTTDMARQSDLETPPYNNLESYLEYKKITPKL